VFTVFRIKNIQFLLFFDNFYFWGKSKMATILANILDDVTGPQQCCNPYYIPQLVKHIKEFLTDKIFAKSKTQQKPRGEVPSTTPPPRELSSLPPPYLLWSTEVN